MDLVEAQRNVEWRGAGLLVLPAEIGEELVGGDGQIPHPALQEIAGQGGLRRDEELRRLRPASDLPEEGAETAEVFLVCPFLGPYLGDGKAEHSLKVRGEK